MHLASIMTADPRCVRPETGLQEALSLMDGAYVRHLPVVSEAGRLVGLLSDRDLLRATGWLPSGRENDPGLDGANRKRPTTVEQVMARNVVTASPDDEIVGAAVNLAGRRIGCLPVVRNDILVGIVSEMDVLSAFLRHSDGQRAGGEENPWIEHLMTWHPTTTAQETSLAEARRLMRVNDIRHLPVIQGTTLVGMLSDRDLRRAHGAGRSKDTEVEEIMTREPVTLTTETTARDAAAVFVRERISAVPIVTAAPLPTLVGIVAVSDLLEHCLSTLRGETEASSG
jgi:CBS domain-containing protein